MLPELHRSSAKGLPCVCSPAGIEELDFRGAGSKYRHTPGPGLLLPAKPRQGVDTSDLAYENHQSNLNHLRSHFVHKTLSVSKGHSNTPWTGECDSILISIRVRTKGAI